MLGDLAATLAGMALLGLVLLPVGTLAGGGLGLAGWRDASPGLRLALAALIGLALVPGGFYLAARLSGSMTVAWGLLALAGAGALARLRLDAARAGIAALTDRRLLLGGGLWLLLGWLIIVDIETAEGLSLSGVLLDYAKHISVTDAVSRTGIPPINPSFFPGEPQPLFYYYFWFLLCSLADQAGGAWVEPRHAVYAGTLWSGLLLVAALRAWAERLPGVQPTATTAVAAALLLVTGLDLIPFLAIHANAALVGDVTGPLPDMEYWNEQVSAWLTAVLWVPHHVGAVLVCLTAFLILRSLPAAGWRRWAALAVVALALVTAAGMSVWVTITAAVIHATWMAVLLWRRERREAIAFLVAGVLALPLALPYLVDLSASRQTGQPPIALSVREFFPLTRSDWLFGVELPCGELCKLAVLPLNYALEFGFFALAAFFWVGWRRGRGPLSGDERFLLTAAAASLVLCSFVKAQVSVSNDLGWRGLMFAQFALLLAAAPVAMALWRSRPWLRAAALLGFAATLVIALQLRARPFDTERAELRRTYDWVAAATPVNTVVQHNPNVTLEPIHTVYGGRQTAASDWHHGQLYGVAPDLAASVIEPLGALFADPPPPAAEVAALARRFGIDYLVVAAADPVWGVKDAWPWTVPAVFETPTTRVVRVSDLESGGGG